MSVQLLVAALLAFLSIASFVIAVVHERQMHRHRQPGVSYAAATLRRDGGWRQRALFTAQGLRHQRRASFFGVLGSALGLAAIVAWVVLSRP